MIDLIIERLLRLLVTISFVAFVVLSVFLVMFIREFILGKYGI